MTPDPWPMCGPCKEVPLRHDACQGADVWCQCMSELLMEAEAEET